MPFDSNLVHSPARNFEVDAYSQVPSERRFDAARFMVVLRDMSEGITAARQRCEAVKAEILGGVGTSMDTLAEAKAFIDQMSLVIIALQNTDAQMSASLAQETLNRNTAISTAINNLINGAPGTLDTLKEIADALAANQGVIGTLTSGLAQRILLSEKGAPGGVASLDGSGKVPAAQLPAGAATTWGTITGTLAAQTDVSNAIAAAQATANGKQSPATSLGGYGIADAYTKTEGDARYAASSALASKVDKTSGVPSGADLNALTTSGFFSLNAAAASISNAPSGVDWGSLINCAGSGASSTGLQIASDYFSSALKWRSVNFAGGTFGAWRDIVHSANIATYAPQNVVKLYDSGALAAAAALIESSTFDWSLYSKLEVVLSNWMGSVSDTTALTFRSASAALMTFDPLGTNMVPAAGTPYSAVVNFVLHQSATKRAYGVAATPAGVLSLGTVSNATTPDRIRLAHTSGNVAAGTRMIVYGTKL